MIRHCVKVKENGVKHTGLTSLVSVEIISIGKSNNVIGYNTEVIPQEGSWHVAYLTRGKKWN